MKVITSTLFIIVSQDREERMNVIGAPASIFPHTYKVMIIGRCGVGKTTLLWRYLYNEFKDLRGTIVDKETKTVKLDGRDLDLELWDTASKDDLI